MWKRLRQPLSLKQMLGVMALLFLMGAGVYGVGLGATTVWHRHLLGGSIPAALAGVRTQRDQLLGIIEGYKAQFGYYPPLLTGPGPARGVVNPLYYELQGAQFDPRTAAFYVRTIKEGLALEEVRKHLNMSSFSNCAPFIPRPTNFLANRALAVEAMSEGSELLGVGLAYTEFTPQPFWGDYQFTAWRYATNPAQHNPGKFDLWVEIKVAGKHFTIGNWPEVK